MSRLPFPEVAHLTSIKVDGIHVAQDEVIPVKEELREKFGKYGEIGDVYIPRDRNFAFVRFKDKRDAEDAVDGMDGKKINGREISVTLSMQAKKMPEDYPEHRRPSGHGGRSRSGGRRRDRDDSRDRRRRGRSRRDESRDRRRRRDRDDSRGSRRR
mmetsp:Transcript_88914/g.248863  ORF Transcript_88914/g.248863 Transcript_88914/m.248863 type:complete len:156 (-) Transcript_88914:53-520(-)